MNEIIQSLYNRKSVRVYEDRAVSAELKKEILLAAMQAPSAGCQQLYTILDITDQALKDRLAVTCDSQPFIARAPLVLVRDGAELREMFAHECEHREFDEWAKAFCRRKYNSVFSREMSRSVEKYLEEYLG